MKMPPKPKFEFGSKVRNRKHLAGNGWSVWKIMFHNNQYYYSQGEAQDYTKEEDLVSDVVLEKKKLYAYEDEDGWIGFKPEELELPRYLVRKPEYDIDYPFLPGAIMTIGKDERVNYIR